MCIYCSTTRYRKIYQEHYGPIPKDADGRSYEIHHIDNDHSNNVYTNLKCVSIQEHYDIHYLQCDYGSCFAIATRMRSTHEELSELARKVANKKLREGTHPFQTPGHQQRAMEAANIINKKRILEGSHNFQGGSIQRKTTRRRVADGTHHTLRRPDGTSLSSDRVAAGTHHWVGGDAVRKQLADGTHTSQIKRICIHCEKSVDLLNFNKWHGDKCPSNPDYHNAVRITSFTTNNPSQEKKVCEHCSKMAGKGNFARWHGDNCRDKT